MKRLRFSALLCAALAAFSCGCAGRVDTEAELPDCAPRSDNDLGFWDCAAIWDEYDALYGLAQSVAAGSEFVDRRVCYECSLTVSGSEQRFYFGWDERGQVTKSLFFRRENGNGYFREFSFCGGEFITAPKRIERAYAILADAAEDAYVVVIQCPDSVCVYDMTGDPHEPVQTIEGTVECYSEGVLCVRERIIEMPFDCFALTGERTFTMLGKVYFHQPLGYIAEKGLGVVTRREASVLAERRILELRAVLYGAFGARSAAVFTDRRTGIACTAPVRADAGVNGVFAYGLSKFNVKELDPAELYELACPEEEHIDAEDYRSAAAELPREEYSEGMRFDLDGDGTDELLTHYLGGFSEGYASKLIVNGGDSVSCPREIKAIGRIGGLFFLTGVGFGEWWERDVACVYRYGGGGPELLRRVWGGLYGVTERGTFLFIERLWDMDYAVAAYTYEPDAEEGEGFRRQSEWLLRHAYSERTTQMRFEAHSAEGVITVPIGSEILIIRQRNNDLPGTYQTVFFTYDGAEYFVVLKDGNGREGYDWYKVFRP